MKCRLCGSELLDPILDLGNQPIAHNYLKKSTDEDILVHPLVLHQCNACGFIQIVDYIKPEILYSNYNFCFSSWKSQPHIPEEVAILRNIKKDSSVLEIGCNDGLFLSALREVGYTDIQGVEPNPISCDYAKKRGFFVYNLMLTYSNSLKILKNRNQQFGIIVVRQVLEHLPDLDDFFMSIRNLLENDGILFLEVPDFSIALKTGDCSTVWEEHPNYFTEQTLSNLLNKYNFSITKIQTYNFSGGALAVWAKQTADKQQTSFSPCSTEHFVEKVRKYQKQLGDKLLRATSMGYSIAMYGSGSRACLIANGLGMGKYLSCVIDDQPERQGLYLPGAKKPIVPLSATIFDNERWIMLLAVNQENEASVIANIAKRFNNTPPIISLAAPNDIFKELSKLP